MDKINLPDGAVVDMAYINFTDDVNTVGRNCFTCNTWSNEFFRFAIKVPIEINTEVPRDLMQVANIALCKPCFEKALGEPYKFPPERTIDVSDMNPNQ